MQNIQNLNKLELKELLRNLRFYNDLTKKIWNRWKKVYEKVFNWKNEYLVEYYWDIEESYVLEKAKNVYKKIFNIDIITNDIKIIKNEKIKWWMKVYLNDDLVDLSFLKFYNLLNK